MHSRTLVFLWVVSLAAAVNAVSATEQLDYDLPVQYRDMPNDRSYDWMISHMLASPRGYKSFHLKLYSDGTLSRFVSGLLEKGERCYTVLSAQQTQEIRKKLDEIANQYYPAMEVFFGPGQLDTGGFKIALQGRFAISANVAKAERAYAPASVKELDSYFWSLYELQCHPEKKRYYID